MPTRRLLYTLVNREIRLSVATRELERRNNAASDTRPDGSDRCKFHRVFGRFDKYAQRARADTVDRPVVKLRGSTARRDYRSPFCTGNFVRRATSRIFRPRFSSQTNIIASTACSNETNLNARRANGRYDRPKRCSRGTFQSASSRG